ncbi:MAG: glucose-1-phosphate thymidylyltransferase [Candidatus Marinimicrobia bacterium]|jgi:glucose-1-phosphate thymidylyltransferase|nr:glucose-1-phosphate thymidylyltransferase [Candidatus Neomarinimicrobiota bacterium]|tara:strand:+ start:1601 stop:2470 length:870 start_codon:yes stop_codon:yes gene_type:complete
MKGIILAGGSGTRLHPITKVVSKQLLPIYDKPMVYYPLSTLMLSGIQDILIISTPEDTPKFERLFENGNHLGLNISYTVQPSPDGLAQAFILGEEFIGQESVSLILGDNIFFGHGLSGMLSSSVETVHSNNDAVVFGYAVRDPERYGVVGFNDSGKVTSIVEKPENPASNYAVVGLYYYPNDVVDIAKNVKPSARGELEITSVNQAFLDMNRLSVELMGRGYAWLDTGTQEAMNNASNFIKTIEDRQGLKVACLEEIAYGLGFIGQDDLDALAAGYSNEYGEYLKSLLD